jgi:hypothetical protein
MAGCGKLAREIAFFVGFAPSLTFDQAIPLLTSLRFQI